METNQFKTHLEKLTKQRNLAYVLILLLSLSLVFASAASFFKKERIIVVPTFGDSYTLGGSEHVFLEKMGVFLSDLILNRSPVDIDWRNRMILKHTDPSFYHELKDNLEREKLFLSKNKEQAFVFYPEKADARTGDLSFVTEGKRIVYVGSDGEKSHISQEDKQCYRLGFRKRGDQLLLISLNKENS